MDVLAQARSFLKQAYGPEATFREGQLEAIINVVEKHKTLVVEKTGWGKSVVYFIATKILRSRGAGPTIIVSPLLALMNNQIEAAEKLQIHAITINSENKSEWPELYDQMAEADAIIVSPERLGNDDFILRLADVQAVQLFVVDEAHSISDWGHDFRPDYQRIVKLLKLFPPDIAILGTTATANNRVIEDIQAQLGQDLKVVRGPLIRRELAIQVNPSQTPEERLGWLVQSLRQDDLLKAGQGIIYCLTQRDCETVASFLRRFDINAESYHAGLDAEISTARLAAFDQGKLRILVATIKLGMGYDKTDLRFVIHFQMPANLIAYYQQIGRAGRDGQPAYAIMLHGDEEQHILESFIQTAQSAPALLEQILTLAESGIKRAELMARLNVPSSQIDSTLRYLLVHEYLFKDHSTYYRTPTTEFDSVAEAQKQAELKQLRLNELQQLTAFLTLPSCYMKFVADELDAPDAQTRCGVCANCLGHALVSASVSSDLVSAAEAFLRNRHGQITPRKMWGTGGRIEIEQQMQPGWVLSQDYYSEVGQLVKHDKYSAEHFGTRLIDLSVDYLKQVADVDRFDLVVAVPSLRRPTLVPEFAEKLAVKLNLPFSDVVHKLAIGHEQKTLLNSTQQQLNIEHTTTVDADTVVGKTILLVDDMVDSKWSFTIIAAKLLQAGAAAVYPFALVKTGRGD